MQEIDIRAFYTGGTVGSKRYLWFVYSYLLTRNSSWSGLYELEPDEEVIDASQN
jgi:hypothetical protein